MEWFDQLPYWLRGAVIRGARTLLVGFIALAAAVALNVGTGGAAGITLDEAIAQSWLAIAAALGLFADKLRREWQIEQDALTTPTSSAVTDPELEHVPPPL